MSCFSLQLQQSSYTFFIEVPIDRLELGWQKLKPELEGSNTDPFWDARLVVLLVV